ncbi:MAG: protein-L-isoaspartate(D-aspartate) O-methyltransferase [Bacteroidia bacterium]|nr:protein-L-isoaspartate(D-aspartate) O-methyltransferase [Bacteroidia bacterium]
MEDSYVHKGLRRKLVQELTARNLFSSELMDAFMRVPRHLFMAKGLEKMAYKDQALPIASGQTISQPFTVAFQTHLLEIKQGDKILEIGTGSGYQTAILLEMGAKVFSIERQKELFDVTQVLLAKLNYRPQLFYGDGYLGQPTYSPFDKIIITAGAPYIPEPLKQQLKIGGRMVVPVGDKAQKMILLIKKDENNFEVTEHGVFQFVPLLQGKSQNK